VRSGAINLIVGFSANKDINKMIEQLSSLKPTSIACTRYTSNPFREVTNPKVIADQFKKLLPTAKIEMFLDPKDALKWSKKQTKKTSDLILVTGSIFLSGELKNNF
jgi:folylpolyglutamate synthase/dihydropteroate synthase